MRTLFLAFLLLAAGLPAKAGPETGPGDLVAERSRAVLAALAERREAFRKDPEALHAFVREQLDSVFDRDYSARLVLGRNGRDVDAEKLAAFADALTRNLLRRYGDALLEVDPGLEVRVKAETPLRGGRIVRVATEIQRRSGPPVPVDYLFHQTAAGWRAFDVIVEGVSYVQTYRSQFDQLLRSESLDSLTAKLARGEIRPGEG